MSNQAAKTEFERAIEQSVGDTVESICETPIDVRRRQVETRLSSPMKVISHWPRTGRRGPPSILSRREVDRLVTRALR